MEVDVLENAFVEVDVPERTYEEVNVLRILSWYFRSLKTQPW